ncbi:MAG TPA: glycoside hydrolase family 3 N-terminal domain-containing protein [Solirubrobacterales bacterium]|jgi:beta-glucosidase
MGSGEAARRRVLLVAAAATAIVLVVATTAFARGGHPPRHHERPGGPPSGAPPYMNPHLPVQLRVKDLLSRMTPAEKVGQMTQAERAPLETEPQQIAELGIGSVLSGGGSVPEPNTPEAWANMVDKFQQAALETRLHIPIIYGEDSVHGDGNLYGATVFPHNIGLGATRDPKLVEEVEHVTAEETRATGPQWVFAPCICAARDDRWGRTYESFGESPELVEEMETAIRGFQGPPGHLDEPDHVLATAKHFAGDGDTVYGTSTNGEYKIDQGVAEANRQEFFEDALRQYVPAVRKYDVGTVMPSYSSIDWTEDGLGNPIKMHAEGNLLTGFLKEQLGFEGFVISDWEGIHQLPGTFKEQIHTAVMAGVDMFMEPFDYAEFVKDLTEEVEAGEVPESRIDDAVSRILKEKFELGLFEHPMTDRSGISEIGDAAHRAVARRAVEESQVLLKNAEAALPIHPGGDVYVAGSNADNIGNQAGGWTLTWQGGSNNPTPIPGTTILEGIEGANQGGTVTFSEDASAPVPAGATGVVVVGETPYSEGYGDVGGPQWGFDPGDEGKLRPPKTMEFSTADREAIDKVCAEAAQCVVVIVSGRPMIIEPGQLEEIDGLVEAWLPGSQGEGVADDLFGKTPFTGKLPVSWPKTLEQEPINVGEPNYDPLFPFGYGLSDGQGHGPGHGGHGHGHHHRHQDGGR